MAQLKFTTGITPVKLAQELANAHPETGIGHTGIGRTGIWSFAQEFGHRHRNWSHRNWVAEDVTMMNDDISDVNDGSGASGELEGITSVKTPDEILFEGLHLAGLDEATQKCQPKSNHRDFMDWCGSTATVPSIVWTDLQSTPFEEACVPVGSEIRSASLLRCTF